MDKKHQKIKLTLKIVGLTCIIIGLACAITGFVSFFVAFNSGDMPDLFFMSFIGIPLLFIGLSCTIIGFKREVTKYMKDENIPITKETLRDITPEFKGMVSSVKGQEESKIRCPHCGTLNDADDRFCKECGKEINNKKTCPNCGEICDGDSKFCQKCGEKL